MLTLGIETSCDETSVAIVRDGREILVNLIASQYEAHRLFGGVVPEIASRKHLEMLNPLLGAVLRESGLTWRDLDLVAVTNAPGLVGALLVGVASAKALSLAHSIPCLPVNHVEGHIMSTVLQKPDLKFPMLCLVVSGGHSDLILMRGIGEYQRLGRTRDDAVGEAFDKVARALGLPQPGGPNLEKLAREGDPRAFAFGVSKLEPSFDFSFSGLKTAGAQAHLKNSGREADIAASFQKAAVAQLQNTVERALCFFARDFAENDSADNRKTHIEYSKGGATDSDVMKNSATDLDAAENGEIESGARERSATQNVPIQTLGLCGGVAANNALRAALGETAARFGIDFVVPESVLCTDNAAMIAAAGFGRWMQMAPDEQRFSLSQLEFEARSQQPIA